MCRHLKDYIAYPALPLTLAQRVEKGEWAHVTPWVDDFGHIWRRERVEDGGRDCVGTGTEDDCGQQECCIDGDSWLIFNF